jgi:hypothetical protein
MSLIFPASSPGVADSAYWRKAVVVGPHGLEEEVWLFETDPTMVEEEALRHVQNLFPLPLGWRPEVRGATFPEGYACVGARVVPPDLEETLNAAEQVDFSEVLRPMSMDDFEALLLRQTDDSTPGISGLTYGHLRAMSRRHRLVYLHLINHFIQFQVCPAQWLEVAIALIPKSDGAQGLGAGLSGPTTYQPDRLGMLVQTGHSVGIASDESRPTKPSPGDGPASTGTTFRQTAQSTAFRLGRPPGMSPSADHPHFCASRSESPRITFLPDLHGRQRRIPKGAHGV